MIVVVFAALPQDPREANGVAVDIDAKKAVRWHRKSHSHLVEVHMPATSDVRRRLAR
jgi:hypothetical protein